MNIKLYTGNSEFSDFRTITSAGIMQKTSAGRVAGDYDRVSLNKPVKAGDDTDFARLLARKAAAQLEAGVDNERVHTLKLQVESGSYHPNARRIAERILGYR